MKSYAKLAWAKRITTATHRTKWVEQRRAFAMALATGMMFAGLPSLPAQTFKVVHTFAGSPEDGAHPYGSLAMDANGNIYGTTFAGGASDAGTVFKVGSKGKETVRYTFTGGDDGAGPSAGLIEDAKGNLYGTTQAGGSHGFGTVFKVNASGKETVLYSFAGGKDGSGPSAGLIRDAKGNLYGTTFAGGASAAGTVFRVNSQGKETVLYSFTGGIDGSIPFGGLVSDTAGNLYGTTYEGGTSGMGTVFKLTKADKETVLHSFAGPEGVLPQAGLIRDAKGNLYGVASAAGGTGCGGGGCGTVFKVNSNGKETTLYHFLGGADGAGPVESLFMDAKGNLYGTTTAGGGATNAGTVFKVNRNGKETVLYSFTGGTDGASPQSGLVMDAKGNLFGTASSGGASKNGTLFKVHP
jgi:uncharacterized repeat protein (TIGR03803 family)